MLNGRMTAVTSKYNSSLCFTFHHDVAPKFINFFCDIKFCNLLVPGNVEIFHMGRWGAVCDDEWDEREANVACRQLGYKQAVKPTHSSHFGQIKREYDATIEYF